MFCAKCPLFSDPVTFAEVCIYDVCTHKYIHTDRQTRVMFNTSVWGLLRLVPISYDTGTQDVATFVTSSALSVASLSHWTLTHHTVHRLTYLAVWSWGLHWIPAAYTPPEHSSHSRGWLGSRHILYPTAHCDTPPPVPQWVVWWKLFEQVVHHLLGQGSSWLWMVKHDCIVTDILGLI